jgi:hypothetical protein
MVSKLNSEDFRAYRLILDPDDFALGDEEPDPPPSDLIRRETWEGIMTLPGDVAIRATSHQGTRIAILYELSSAWIHVIRSEGIVSHAMLEAGDDFEAALFNLLHGFYKQAIAALRSAIEVMTLGCVCEIAVDTATWTAWQSGREVKFNELCDKMQRLPTVRALEDEARRKTGTGLYAGDNGSGRNAWVRDLYRRLSRYSHARGTATNFRLWRSNGPIYSGEGMRLSYHSFLEAYALLVLIGRIACPNLRMPRGARIIYKRDSLNQYLAPHIVALCEHYVSTLFARNAGKNRG